MIKDIKDTGSVAGCSKMSAMHGVSLTNVCYGVSLTNRILQQRSGVKLL